MDYDAFLYLFDIMAFQRNIKAIGTFTYQAGKLHREQYEQYVRPTFYYLLDYVERREELDSAYDIITQYIEVNL